MTFRNSNIAKFGTRDEQKTILHGYKNRQGHRIDFEQYESIYLYTEGDSKMKHRKRENASGLSSKRSNINCAMRVRMPKVPAYLAPQLPNPQITADITPQNTSFQVSSNLATQDTASYSLITAQPNDTAQELQHPSTSAPIEALQQILPKTEHKRPRRSTKYCGCDKDVSSGESTNSCPTNWTQPRGKRQAGDVESVQPCVVQSIIDTAAQVEPIDNPYTWPAIAKVSPTDPRIRPVDHSPDENLFIDEEDLQKNFASFIIYH